MMDKLWNSNYKKVMVANFTMSFAFYLLTPLLPLYLSETFGSTKDMIGLVLSGYTITALLFRPFSGYVVDSFPRKKVLLVCLFLYFILFGGYLLASTLLMFAILRTLHGGPFGASTVANNTVAIDVVPSSRRNEAIGYYGLSNNLAMAIAPTIGVFVYKYVYNFDVLFWLALVVAGIGFAVDYTLKLPEKQLMKDKKAISLDRFFLLKGWVIGLNICFFGFCYGILSNYLAIYGKEVMGITGGTGAYFMLLSIGLILSRLQGAKSLREGKLTRNAAQGIILSTIGYTMFIAMPNMVGYYGSAILIGLGNGHMWPALQNMIINVAQNNERGTANSTLLTSWDLGVGIGILLGGSIAEYFSYATAFWTMAWGHVAGLALFFMFTKQSFLRRKRTESFR
ncbi:MAG: MFS transporter [Bacteroidaceae bacterium]|nr:MFS transporter [Bacteroidaceae bacterium]